MPNSQKDVHKKLLGKKGEKLVAEYLKAQGCKVLKTNYRTPFGEADLIVQDGDEIAFVEVKTRKSTAFGAPKDAVDIFKQRRYYEIARYFWKQTGEEPNARFDVAQVFAGGEIEYIKNAF